MNGQEEMIWKGTGRDLSKSRHSSKDIVESYDKSNSGQLETVPIVEPVTFCIYSSETRVLGGDLLITPLISK